MRHLPHAEPETRVSLGFCLFVASIALRLSSDAAFTHPLMAAGRSTSVPAREVEHKAVRAEAIQSVIGLLEAKAQFDAPKQEVHVRVAERDDKIYIDLADMEWRAVEISADGWDDCRHAVGTLPPLGA